MEFTVRNGEHGYCFYLDGNEKMKLDPFIEVGIIVLNNADGQAVAAAGFQRNEADYSLVKN